MVVLPFHGLSRTDWLWSWAEHWCFWNGISFLSTIYDVDSATLLFIKTELQKHAVNVQFIARHSGASMVVLIRFETCNISPEKHLQNDSWSMLIMMGMWLMDQCSKTLQFGLKIPGGSRPYRYFDDRLIWGLRMYNIELSCFVHM